MGNIDLTPFGLHEHKTDHPWSTMFWPWCNITSMIKPCFNHGYTITCNITKTWSTMVTGTCNCQTMLGPWAKDGLLMIIKAWYFLRIYKKSGHRNIEGFVRFFSLVFHSNFSEVCSKVEYCGSGPQHLRIDVRGYAGTDINILVMVTWW
jgi:hypothetical protein